MSFELTPEESGLLFRIWRRANESGEQYTLGILNENDDQVGAVVFYLYDAPKREKEPEREIREDSATWISRGGPQTSSCDKCGRPF